METFIIKCIKSCKNMFSYGRYYFAILEKDQDQPVGNVITCDDSGDEHIIANNEAGNEKTLDDPWFKEHFEIKSSWPH